LNILVRAVSSVGKPSLPQKSDTRLAFSQ